HQQNLLRLVTEQIARELFKVGENFRRVVEIRLHNLLLQRGIPTAFYVVINSREHPVPRIHRDPRYTIAALDEELFRLAPCFQIAAGVEIRMSKISQRLMVLRHQQSRDALALNHTVFKSFQATAVQRSMRVGVVTKLESGVEPHV